MPMHRLHCILDFKVIIFNKVDDQYHSVIQKNLKALSKLLILPHNNEVVSYKVLQLWLQLIMNKINYA